MVMEMRISLNKWPLSGALLYICICYLTLEKQAGEDTREMLKGNHRACELKALQRCGEPKCP